MVTNPFKKENFIEKKPFSLAMKPALVLLLVLLTLPLALAEEDYTATVELLGQQVMGQELPPGIALLFGNQKMNVHVTLENKEVLIVALVTEQGKIKSIGLAEAKEPTLDVYTTGQVLQDILNAKDQGLALKAALREKKLTYKAHGFSNRLLLLFASLRSKFKDDNTAGQAAVEIVSKDKLEEKTNLLTATIAAEIEAAKEEVKIEEEPVYDPHHLVEMIDGGFGTPELKIKVGDTIEWKNIRTNPTYPKAMIIGTMKCSKIKSKIYQPGESFSWTFDAKLSCLIVDGVYTTQTMKVTVE